MELFFDANKIFVPSNATKTPDISCFIYIFSGAEGGRRQEDAKTVYRILGCAKELPVF